MSLEDTQDPAESRPQIPFAYGYTGIGVCQTCREVRTLFVHSAVHTDNTAWAECHQCIERAITLKGRELYDSNDSLFRTYFNTVNEWSRLSNKLLHTRTQVRNHEFGCRACLRFFSSEHVDSRYHPVSAFDPIAEETIQVHQRCAFTCIECNTVTINNGYTPSLVRYSESIEYRINNRAYFMHGASVCLSCFDKIYSDTHTQCYNCSLYTLTEDMHSRFGGDLYCNRCNDRIYACEECNRDYYEDDDHECVIQIIRSYDWAPDFGYTFHGHDNNELFLGFELEVENSDECGWNTLQRKAKPYALELEGSKRGFIKSDGSLNCGFEIVSQPHTLEAYNEFPWSVIENLVSDGFHSWDTSTCGFHIHVSRSAFGWDTNRNTQSIKTEAHVLRWLKLLYDNRRYVQRLAGRSSDEWASFEDAGRLVPKVKRGYQSNGRYSAVNVNNTHTFEVRVFKGSMRISRIKANLQFVHSTVEYTRDLSVSPNNNTLAWSAYRTWLSSDTVNTSKYAHLIELLNNLPRTRREESESN